MVRVTNDLLIASDSSSLSMLILIDLSATFDTVSHNLLLNCLEMGFGVLAWFRPYLSDRPPVCFYEWLQV